jgi:hypothetical protein
MLDQIATAYLTVRHGGLVDNSARPDAPVVAPIEPRPRAARTRALLAAQLHRVARALEPHPRREQALTHGLGASACR